MAGGGLTTKGTKDTTGIQNCLLVSGNCLLAISKADNRPFDLGLERFPFPSANGQRSTANSQFPSSLFTFVRFVSFVVKNPSSSYSKVSPIVSPRQKIEPIKLC